MDIGGILSGIELPLRSSRSGDAAEPAPVSATASVRKPGATALRDVLSRYDMRNITPKQFAQFAQELRQGGLVTQDELQEISLIRLEMDQANIQPDEPVDLLKFLSKKLEKLQGSWGSPEAGGVIDGDTLQTTLRQLDWVRKFDGLQSKPDSASLDALA